MKRIRCGAPASLAAVAIFAIPMVSCSTAESGESGSADERPVPTIASGTQLVFTVDERISTDTHKAGDRFTASLGSRLLDAEGSPVLQAGTPSRWVVKQSSREGEQAVLAVELESMLVDGDWMPVAAVVTEADLNVDERDSDGETAAKIGVGAAAGAILGQLLGGDTEATLTGAGVGAAMGTVVALSTRGSSAVLPAGSTISVDLTQPLVTS